MILNSGLAKRLKPLTDNMPKCLLEVNGETILGRQLKCLRQCGVNDIIVTTGPFEDQIISFIEERFPGMRVKFVNNPRFAETNYIYSIWLARDLVDDDILLLHGDMIFECPLLERLVSKEPGNYVLVNNVIEPPVKDFKARVKDGMVTEIGVDLTGENTYFCAPVYRFAQNGFQGWIREMGACLEEGRFNCYAEDAFNRISDNLRLEPVYFGSEGCMEIDSREDLRIAREAF